MAPNPQLRELAATTLRIELQGVQQAFDTLGDSLYAATDLLLTVNGKVVVVGVGKSGLIGQKISATLSSTGTPSIFLHPVEALHGDLGVLQPADALLMISNSGSSGEIAQLLGIIRQRGNPVVALTGHRESILGRNADVVLCTGPLEEACPLGLAPTTSTTAALVIGDILAVLLMRLKGFSRHEFAEVHPAGKLGRTLAKVADVMRRQERLAVVATDASFEACISAVDRGGIGTAAVVDAAGRLVGVITDGDIRRALRKGPECFALQASAIMGRQPKQVSEQIPLSEALESFEKFRVSSLFAVDTEGRPTGVLHLHDAMEGRRATTA